MLKNESTMCSKITLSWIGQYNLGRRRGVISSFNKKIWTLWKWIRCSWALKIHAQLEYLIGWYNLELEVKILGVPWKIFYSSCYLNRHQWENCFYNVDQILRRYTSCNEEVSAKWPRVKARFLTFREHDGLSIFFLMNCYGCLKFEYILYKES